MLVTKDGTLWAGTEGGGLIRYKDGRFRVFGLAEGLANGFVRVIYEDKNRQLWVGTDTGLFRMLNESLIRVDGQGGAPKMSVHAICEDREGAPAGRRSGIIDFARARGDVLYLR